MPHDHTHAAPVPHAHAARPRHTLLQRGAAHRLAWAAAVSGVLWWALTAFTGMGL